MSEFKTLEQKFLADFAALELENQELKEQLAAKEKCVEEAKEEEGKPSPRLIERPIETIYLSIAGTYKYKDMELTSTKVREICSTREKLEGFANQIISPGSWHSKPLDLEHRNFPYTLNLMGEIYGLDFWRNNDEYEPSLSRIERSDVKLRENHYYMSDRYEELYEFGLARLKEQLLRYADKLEEKENE